MLKGMFSAAMLMLCVPALAGTAFADKPAPGRSLLDVRLADAQDFARYVDVSRARQGGSAAPVVVVDEASGARTAAPAWQPSRSRAARMDVPPPFIDAAQPRPARPSRRVPFIRLVGLTLMMIGFSGFVSRQKRSYDLAAATPYWEPEEERPFFRAQPRRSEPLTWGPDREPDPPPIVLPSVRPLTPWC